MRLSHPAGAFEIESLPSQPQVAHCHGFFVRPEMRGRGQAHVLKSDQMSALRYLSYDYALCTVCSNNAAQKTVLARAGWAKLAEFTSGKTGEEVEIWGWEVSSELT
jgi:hypothetical protein